MDRTRNGAITLGHSLGSTVFRERASIDDLNIFSARPSLHLLLDRQPAWFGCQIRRFYLGSRDLGGGWMTGLLPGSPAAVQEPNVFDSPIAQDPPDPRGVGPLRITIDDDPHRWIDSNATEPLRP